MENYLNFKKENGKVLTFSVFEYDEVFFYNFKTYHSLLFSKLFAYRSLLFIIYLQVLLAVLQLHFLQNLFEQNSKYDLFVVHH